MRIANFFKKLFSGISGLVFDNKWRCNACGKEIFSGQYFCDECLQSLPYNDKLVCKHCGRMVEIQTDYCQTCKNNLVSIDVGRSPFVYNKPINALIKQAKYNGKRYLLEIFAQYLAEEYNKNNFNCEVICYVPASEKSVKKRGYNQSQILAEKLSELIGVKVIHALAKTKETPRQAKLTRKQRLDNLTGAFTVKDKREVKNKSILLVDDVSTTGATAEAISQKLKRANAKSVILLTVASVPSYDKY